MQLICKSDSQKLTLSQSRGSFPRLSSKAYLQLLSSIQLRPMQTNILWSGREYHSLENCLVTTTESGNEINSVIVSRYGHKIYRVEYRIQTNELWQTVFFEVKSQHLLTQKLTKEAAIYVR